MRPPSTARRLIRSLERSATDSLLGKVRDRVIGPGRAKLAAAVGTTSVGVWVPRTLVTSCDLGIFADQAPSPR